MVALPAGSKLPGVDDGPHLLHRFHMPASDALTDGARARLIVAIATSADRNAFIALFEFYAPRIKAQAMRFGLEASAAEDVAQETLLAVWRRASQFDPQRGTASAWVFAIATNARIDRLRRDKSLARSVVLEEDSPLMVAEADTGGVEVARLSEIVSTLPEEQRRIVQMSFYSDMPHGEIASRLGLPLGTVKSRIRLAISKLRYALSEKS